MISLNRKEENVAKRTQRRLISNIVISNTTKVNSINSMFFERFLLDEGVALFSYKQGDYKGIQGKIFLTGLPLFPSKGGNRKVGDQIKTNDVRSDLNPLHYIEQRISLRRYIYNEMCVFHFYIFYISYDFNITLSLLNLILNNHDRCFFNHCGVLSLIN